MNDISVILPAAGSGTRMKAAGRKQFLRVQGRPLMQHTIDVFTGIPGLREIIIVHPPGEAENIKRLLDLNTDIHIIFTQGGARRQDSVENGLKVSSDQSQIIVVHDAVRPLVKPATITNAVQTARRCGSALVAIPVTDTIKRVADGRVIETVERSDLWRAQTPQVFSRELLIQGFRIIHEQGRDVTDDCAVVEAADAVTEIVTGDEENIKITTREDLQLMEYILKNRAQTRKRETAE